MGNAVVIIQKWSLPVNVSELVHFETRNGIAAHYDYAPFGAVTRAISASAVTDNTFTTDNPFRFSSECHDDTLGLVYYNYRHYNPIDGRWCGRDRYSFKNLYYFKNGILGFDLLGNKFSVEPERLPMVEIDQIARSLDDEPDDPMRVYRGATLVVRAGWRSPGIIFLSTSSSEGCICAKYSYPEYDIELRQLLPNNNVDARGRIYTDRGRVAIVSHENRRVLVYALAYNAYYREYEGGGKTKTFCASNEEDLSKKVNKLDKVVKEYIEQNQDLITEEDLTPKMVETDNGWAFDGYLNPHRVLRPQSLD